MKRVILWALLAMGLPTAALADISFSPGTFSSGTLVGSFPTALDVTRAMLPKLPVTDTGTLTLQSSCPVPGVTSTSSAAVPYQLCPPHPLRIASPKALYSKLVIMSQSLQVLRPTAWL